MSAEAPPPSYTETPNKLADELRQTEAIKIDKMLDGLRVMLKNTTELSSGSRTLIFGKQFPVELFSLKSGSACASLKKWAIAEGFTKLATFASHGCSYAEGCSTAGCREDAGVTFYF